MTDRIDNPTLESVEQAMVITRIFAAPRRRVFAAWTEPEQLKRWWGPRAFTTPYSKMDLRVGGKYLNCMRSPEGQDYWSTGVYREISRPERVVCSDSFADEKGNVVPAIHYGLGADFPTETQISATFADLGGKTELTLRHDGIPSGHIFEDCHQGWSQSFDKLAEYLAK